MPGVFIGIGGIGGTIVSQVRQALNVRVAFAGDTPSALEAAGQFRFLLIDTWKDGATKGFDQSQVFDLPVGKDKFGVDATIDTWFHGADDTFPHWWPERSATDGPWKVGDFEAGAGQLRIKGKLAYRIALTGQGQPVVPAVQSALHAIDSVLGPAPSIRTVPIYLVCSLGGGTGSGMALTFAQHLREVLTDNYPLIGVFPLAGVTALGPGGADTKSVWANTDAALREIDYCQRTAGTSDNLLTPLFKWPGNGNVLYGKKRPFSHVYLFGHENQSGQPLRNFSQYTDLIAETLIAESFSSLIDEGLQTGISGPHSQFIMQLQERPEIGGQATTYASAAIGSLVFPAERIERHLGRRYAMAVLDRMVQTPQSQVTSRVDDFLQKEGLEWNGKPPFQSRLRDALVDKSGKRTLAPTFPTVLDPMQDEAFAKADQSQAGARAAQARAQLATFAGERLAPHLRRRRTIIIAEYAGQDRGIRQLAHELLADGGPSALGLTHAVVDQVKQRLEQQWNDLNEQIEGNEKATIPIRGKKRELADLFAEDRWDSSIRQLHNGFGGGLRRVFDRNGKKAKTRFFDTTWKPLREATTELELLKAGRETYQALVTETAKVERALRELIDQIRTIRSDLERSTRTDIGEHGKAGVLDLAILDDPRLVAHRFDELLQETVAQGADACASRVTTPSDEIDPAAILLEEEPALEAPAVTPTARSRTGIVREVFDRKLDPRGGGSSLLHERFRDHLMAAIVDDGVRQLGRHVRDLSIWEALAAECMARERLGLEDAAVTAAIAAVQSDRAAAELAGVPPKDWEQEALRHFIRNKLFECQKRVRPFWNLNGLMTANFGQPHHFTVIAADREAYRIADTTFGIGGVLEATSALMRAGTPQWLPGRDRIVIYAREGVAPLFYLNDHELKNLRDAAAQKKAVKFLYTDRRFEDVIDEVIRPQESTDEVYRFAIALGLQLGLISRIEPDAQSNGHSGRLGFRVEDGSEYSDIIALDTALTADAERRERLITRVNAEMERISAAERDAELQRALNRVKKLHQEAARAQHSAEARWWKRSEQIILARMTYGQYFVAV